ncbi:hypothetical protein ACFLR7_04585 [Acidobacteriota bacterium]
MKKVKILLAVLLVAGLCLNAGIDPQDKTSDPEVQKRKRLELDSRGSAIQDDDFETWVRHYPASATESVNFTKATRDNGFISVVMTRAFSEGNLRGTWVMKASSIGVIEWQRFLKPDLALVIYCIDETDDGGFILGGSKAYSGFNSFPTTGIVVKLTHDGEIQWTHIYGGASGSKLTFIEQTDDGGFITAGINGRTTDVAYKNFWVMKLSRLGEVEWSNMYGGPGYEGDWMHAGLPSTIRPTSDDGYLLAGITNSFGNEDYEYEDYDVWVIKLDPLGQIEWQNIYGGEFDEEFYYTPTVAEAHDESGYFVAASTYSFWESEREWPDLWVLKLNLDGSIEWQNLYGGDGGDLIGGIVATEDNGIVVAGTTGSYGYGADVHMFLLKLNGAGMIEWERSFGRWAEKTSGRTIQKTVDGGFLVTGSSWLLESTDPWVLKSDPLGRLDPPCGLMEDTYSFIIETAVTPIPTSVEPDKYGGLLRVENSPVMEPQVKSLVYCWSNHEPPINVQLEKETNRSFSRGETNYVIKWSPNPENAEFNIVEYRAYRVDNSRAIRVYQLVGSVPSGAFEIKDNQVDTSKYFRYYITAVDENGYESSVSDPPAKSWE